MEIENELEKLNNLSLDEFVAEVNRLVEITQNCFEDALLSNALDFFSHGTGIEYYYLVYAMAEAEIKRAVKRGVQGGAISELLEECIMSERRFYELLYKPESFDDKLIKWLPDECQYNNILVKYITEGKSNLQLILQAAKLRPDMAQVFKCWIGA